MGLGIAVAEAGLPHHLLAIMGPALGISVADKDLAEGEAAAVGVEEVEEVAGPDLVDRGEEKVRLAWDEAGLDRRRPARVRRGDIIDRRQAGLVGPGNVDVGEIL